MIRLHIEKHCKNCPNFDVEQNTLYMADATGKTEAEHHLRCKNEGICRNIKEHLTTYNTSKSWMDGFRDGLKRANEDRNLHT